MKWGIVALLFLLPLTTFAQNFSAGFVQGLWYTPDSFFVGDTVRIYAAIRNNTGSDLSATVTFYDNQERIGSATISALDGRIIEGWVDWVPRYGEHAITAKITRLELYEIGKEAQEVDTSDIVAKDLLFVDYDTDADGVGNREDVDDDGDGISDKVEIQNGTDPLVYDEDVPDAREIQKSTSTQDTSQRLGLEQYLTPSRANTLLSSITQYTQSAKKKLDDYRQNRSRASDNREDVQALTDIKVNADGFGEIERIEKEAISDSAKKQEEVASTVTSAIYTGMLATLSWLLSYPMLIQLLLLFGILYILLKTAQKLSRRPQ